MTNNQLIKAALINMGLSGVSYIVLLTAVLATHLTNMILVVLCGLVPSLFIIIAMVFFCWWAIKTM